MAKVAIIAALEREMRPLVRSKGWRRTRVLGATYGAFESDAALVVCAGIGPEPARMAAEHVVAAVKPGILISAGLAGALVPRLSVGQIVVPAIVIHSFKAAPVEVTFGPEIRGLQRKGVLVSTSEIAGEEGKRLLARQHEAQIVDMEAASVAEVAASHGLPFLAIKSISDGADFPMPDMGPFIGPNGKFLTGRFLLHFAFRPRMWPIISKLASNSSKASQELCRVLRVLLDTGAFNPAPKNVVAGNGAVRSFREPVQS